MRVLKPLVILLLIATAAASTVAYRAYDAAQTPYRNFGHEVFFTVERGAAGASIARDLREAGIVEDERIFKAALRLRGDTSRIQAGEVSLLRGRSPRWRYWTGSSRATSIRSASPFPKA